MTHTIPTTRRQALAAAAALASQCLLPVARAQTPTPAGAWPTRPIKWIVSQPAGAGPDIVARYLADILSRTWGQPVVVDNKPGGQNVIGSQLAARSAPDGYTFFYATTASMVTNSFTFKSLPYDPDKDFVPIILVGRSPFILAASANAGIKSMADLIAQAKAQPGKIAVATDGPKTFSGMLADSVAAMAGIKLNHVPYSKTSDALQDVITGRVQLICQPDAALVPYMRSGQMNALAVSTAQRVPNLPEVPTLSDTFAGFEYSGWNGLFAPAGTPPDIVARVNRDLAALLAQPDVVQRMQSLGSIAAGGTNAAGFAAFMKSERERWARIVKDIGITPE